MEKIISMRNGRAYEIDTRPASLLRPWEREMLKAMKKPMTARQVGEQLGISEQLANYRIQRLVSKGLAKESHRDISNGVLARFYVASSSSFYEAIGSWHSSEQKRVMLNGEAVVVTGSPDPHGPLMARSRDIEHSVMIGNILGRFVGNRVTAVYDTLFTRELASENLFLLGGPIVNFISKRFNSMFKTRFARDYSIIHRRRRISGKNMGLLASIENPADPEKLVVMVAGIGYNGTRAALLAMRDFHIFSSLVGGKDFVIEGIDRDGDGKVDDWRELDDHKGRQSKNRGQ